LIGLVGRGGNIDESGSHVKENDRSGFCAGRKIFIDFWQVHQALRFRKVFKITSLKIPSTAL